VAGIGSPDVPAYYAYGLVLLLGIVVARHTVNERLASHPDRWAFAGTWWLFLTHIALALLLFWFLDYTSVIHDTSLVSAALVAFGYQQIFAGGFQGIQLTGQAAALWKPFDSWVAKVVDRMAARSKLYLDHFEYKVRARILDDQTRSETFRSLALARSKNPAALAQSLSAFVSTGDADADRRLKIDIVWRDLRAAEPDLYGWLLYQRGVVHGWTYWMWLKNGRSKLISAAALLGLLAAIALVFAWFSGFPEGSDRRHNAQIRYHQWRFLKSNTTDRDRWRSREFLAAKLDDLAERPVPVPAQARAAAEKALAVRERKREELKKLAPGAGHRSAQQAEVETADQTWSDAVDEERRALDAEAVVTPLLKELRYPGIATNLATDILALLVNAHSPNLNHAWVPLLIESLRTQNEVTRLETRKALVALQKADYPATRLGDDLEKWEPKKDEAVGDIDTRVRRFQEWWQKASGKTK
jgi:hypothetical protein